MRHLEQTIDSMSTRISELESRIAKLEQGLCFNTKLSEPVEVVGSWVTTGNTKGFEYER